MPSVDTVELHIEVTANELLADIRKRAEGGTLTQKELAVALEAQTRFIEYLDELLEMDSLTNLDNSGTAMTDAAVEDLTNKLEEVHNRSVNNG